MDISFTGTPLLPLTAIDFDNTDSEVIVDDDVITHLREQGKDLVQKYKEDDKHFIETKASKAANELLSKTNFIIIKGEAGHGKSSLAKHLCLKIVRNGSYFIKTDLEILRHHCNPSKRQVILLEDFLEGTVKKRLFNSDLQHQINYIWPLLTRLTKSRYVHIIATTRSSLVNESLSDKNEDLISLPGDEFTFNLNATGNELSIDEKKQILETICKQNSVDIPEIDTDEEIVNKIQTDFPLSCLLYATCGQSLGLETVLKEDPVKWLYKFLDTVLEKNQHGYAALVFLSFTGGKVTSKAEALLPQEYETALHFIDKEHPASEISAVNELLDKLEKDTTGLVKNNGEEFEFIHRVVYETVAKHAGINKSGPFQFTPLFHVRDFYKLDDSSEPITELTCVTLNPFHALHEDSLDSPRIKDYLHNRFKDGINSGELANVFYMAKKFHKDLNFEHELCSLSKKEILALIPITDNTEPWQTFTYWVAKLGYQNLLKKIKEVSKHGIFGFLHRSRPPVDPLSLFGACEGRHHQILADLLKIVSEKNYRCDGLHGKTVLHIAAERNDTAAAEILIKAKVGLMERDDYLYLPIHYAAEVGAAEIVESLIKGKADDIGKYDMHTLHYASINGHRNVIEKYCSNIFPTEYQSNSVFSILPIEYAMILRSKSALGLEPVHCASISGAARIFNFLVKQDDRDILHGKDCTGHTPLHFAARYGMLESLQNLLDWHVSIEAKAQGARKPFHFAARSGNKECVDFFLAHGAQIDETDQMGNSVLHFAVPICSASFVQFLISKGAQVSVQNKSGMEPIHFACTAGCTDNVEALLAAGADIHAKDDGGKTPILFAASNGQTDTTIMLLNHGVSINETDDDGHDALMYAASDGHHECAKVLLDHGSDVNATDSQGIGAMQAAVTHGCLRTFKLFLDHGADTQITDKQGRQLLQFAASNGHTEILKLLIEVADIHYTDNAGMQAIHYACSNGHLGCLKILLENGASVKARDNKGGEPIHYAVSNGHKHCLELLLDAGSDVRARDSEGKEPIHYACSQGHIVCLRVLMNHDACVEACDNQGKTPMHYAAVSNQWVCVLDLLSAGALINSHDYEKMREPIHYAAACGPDSMVAMLLLKGASVTARDKDMLQPIHFAAAAGNLDTLLMLLGSEADIEAKDSDGWTPLMCAVKANSPECIEELLKANADIAAKENGGAQAIHLAASFGFKDCVSKLLKHKADARAIKHDGSEPVHFAASAGSVEILLMLHQQGANVKTRNSEGNTPIHLASTSGHLPFIKCLVELKADPFVSNKAGRNALHFAASNGHVDCLKFLLELDEKPDTDMTDGLGCTAVMFAASNGHIECLKLLLEHGADVKTTNKEGRNSLHYAASNGHNGCLEILLTNGADPTNVDQAGSAPMSLAASNGHLQCMELLVEHSADVNTANKDGTQPIHYSSSKGHKKCLEYLVEKGSDVNALDGKEICPIHYASSNGHTECLTYLLDQGADINATYELGKTNVSALHLAVSMKHEDCAQLLIARGIAVTLEEASDIENATTTEETNNLEKLKLAMLENKEGFK